MSFTVHRDELPSGLPVVTVETPHLHSAMVTVYVRIGSRYESAANSGVSHLLEHLFFRGSRRFRDTVRMNARVEAVGGNLNGVTMRDLSYYYTPVHPSGVPVALEVHDSGAGVDPSNRGKIFEPFFSTQSNGTGLGLSLSAQIVAAHGGRLELLERGPGATFAIRVKRT